MRCIPADVFVVDEWRRLVYCAGNNQQKQAKTALEKCQHLPFILKYTVVPANMLLLMPIIQMIL